MTVEVRGKPPNSPDLVTTRSEFYAALPLLSDGWEHLARFG